MIQVIQNIFVLKQQLTTTTSQLKKRDSYEPLLLDLPWNISANGKAGEMAFLERLKLMALAPTSFEHLNIYNEARFERGDLTYQWIGCWLLIRDEKKTQKKKNEHRRVEGFCFLGWSVVFFADLTYSQREKGYDKCSRRISRIEELNGCRPGLCAASCKICVS